ENPDILAELVAGRSGKAPVIVGFAAETGDEDASVIEHATAKLARKGCDFLVVNDVGGGRAFDRLENEVTVLGDDGSAVPVPRSAKIAVAQVIWDLVSQRLDRTGG